MEAVILAAGEGIRMRPLTSNRPKAMLPIANKPILEHIIIEAKKAGITDFVIVAGYKDDEITSYFGNGDQWGVRIFYRLQQQATGTADALRLAQSVVRGNFLVLNGDIIVNEHDIRKISQSDQITIGVKKVSDPSGFGIIEEKGGAVRHIFEKSEKPTSNLANTGVYLMTQQIFPAISNTAESERGEFELTRSLEMLIEQGVPVRCETIECWQDISYPWDLLDANATAMSGMSECIEGMIEENVHIDGPVNIGHGTIIRSGSYIVGPVCIGRDCDIGPNCYIRPSTSIADNCRIGAGVEIKNSIIMRRTFIPHQNFVGDSIIGENCNLGAGTKIANLRLDKTPIRINGQNTNRNRLGAILGDGVMTGINVSINARTIIGNNVWIGPGMLAIGAIADNTRLLNR
jgi:bifunctional UDP-N-acetylglucosamine pyrophosphorylase/glucosamine-1-phosphate N-acetyltransferase